MIQIFIIRSLQQGKRVVFVQVGSDGLVPGVPHAGQEAPVLPVFPVELGHFGSKQDCIAAVLCLTALLQLQAFDLFVLGCSI